MDGSIPWYQSKAVWGSLLAMVSPMVGVVIPIDAASEIITQVIGAIGGAIALYGRVTAKQTIATPSKE